MYIHSPEFLRKKPIPAKFTCDGADIHPTLLISEVPSGTKSLAIVFDDINSIKGTWVHWVVWNTPPETVRIEEGTLPEGAVEGANDFGRNGYGGPCPTSGEHMYIFRLYALDTILALPAGSSREELDIAMLGHLLAQAELPGVYARTAK